MSQSTNQRIRSDWGHVRTLVPLCFAAMTVAILLVTADASAQVPRPRPGSAIPGMSPAQRNPPPGAQKKAPPKKTKDRTPVDNTTLPPGYVIPPEPPAEFTTTEEWTDSPFEGLSSREKTQLITKYRDLMNKGRFSNEKEEKKLVDDVIRGKLSELTKKEARDENKVVERRQEVMREMKLPKSVPREVRTYALESIVRQAPKLLEYHILARINGVILLSELNEVDEEGTGSSPIPAIPYVPAYDPLLKVLNDEKQHDGVRALAVKGLVRIAVFPELRTDTRHQIVEALVSNLDKSAKSDAWLQYRLVDAFAEIKIIYSRDKKPYVVQALAQVLVDVNRPWLVRSHTAYALGRLPYDREIDLTLLSFEIVKMTRQMAAAYAKQPGLPEWRNFFFDSYLAFKPATEAEDKSKDGGLLKQLEFKGAALASHKKPVQDAYAQVLSLVVKVLREEKGIQDAMLKVDAWLAANPPPKRNIGLGQPDLINHELKAAPVGNNPNTAAPAATPPATGG
jgi:hypothetical protein